MAERGFRGGDFGEFVALFTMLDLFVHALLFPPLQYLISM